MKVNYQDSISSKPWLVSLYHHFLSSFHILEEETESSETLHVIPEFAKCAPTNQKASPSLQWCRSKTGTDQKLHSCPCTMSLHSFPARVSLHDPLTAPLLLYQKCLKAENQILPSANPISETAKFHTSTSIK